MIRHVDRHRGKLSWAISIILHVCLILLCVKLLIQPPRFDVTSGRSSSAIELALVPTPVQEVVVQPTPTPPVPMPTPDTAVPPTPVVQTIPTALPIFHDKVLIPPPPHVVSVAQTHTVPPAHPKSATPKQSNDLARGSSTPSVDELHNTPPDYPPESQAAGENGTVMLLVMVSAKGEPDKVSIMKSSGYFRLDQAAREAVRQWKFHPAVVAGVDVPGPVTVPVLFHLNPGN